MKRVLRILLAVLLLPVWVVMASFTVAVFGFMTLGWLWEVGSNFSSSVFTFVVNGDWDFKWPKFN